MTIGIVGLPHYFPDGFFIDTTMNKKYVVYEHVTPDGMYYFGQTQNVERRWSNNGAEYKGTALQPYIEKFGWENIKHIILFENQTKEDALFIEDFLIETAREDGVCINQRRSGLISKEEGYDKNQSKQYYEINKEQVQERHKQYYETNKDKILEQQKKYQDEHKDKIRKYQCEYYDENRDKILEQSRQYYQKNREKRLEQRKQRYQRKKLEKQLKEVETTLF